MVGDVAQDTCLIHRLEAFNCVGERLLELKEYFPRSGVPGQNLPGMLSRSGERGGEETPRRCGEKGSTLHRSILDLLGNETGRRSVGIYRSPVPATVGIVVAVDAGLDTHFQAGGKGGDGERACCGEFLPGPGPR